jgi:hypothetical protein
MVLTVSFVISLVIGLFVTIAPKKLASRELDASVEASGPHDFAVRESLSPKPPGGPGTGPAEALAKVDQRRSSRAAAASTASHPNVRDDRETPLGRARFQSLLAAHLGNGGPGRNR